MVRAKRSRRVEYLDLGGVPKPERRLAFAEAALGPLRPVAARTLEREWARLEELVPGKVELLVPQAEYESIRILALGRRHQAESHRE